MIHRPALDIAPARVAPRGGSLVAALVVLVAPAACSIPDDTFVPSGPGSGPGEKLAFVNPPGTAYLQQPMRDIQVAIVDAAGAPVAGKTDAITLALGANPGAATLLGELTVAAVDGVASFDLVGLDQPGVDYTLVASAAGFEPVTSAPFRAAPPPFQLMSTGIYGGRISSVAVSPAPTGGTTTIFAGLATGVYRSTNNGATWTPASFGFASAAGTVVTDPRNAGVAYAVQASPSGGVAGGDPYFLKKTTNGGRSWLEARDQTITSLGDTVAVDPSSPQIVYVGGLKLYRSSNGGTSWTELTFPYECQLVTVDPVNSSVYCAAYDRSASGGAAHKGVYKSINGGDSWAPVNTGLGQGNIGALIATPVAVFVAVNIIGTGNRLFRSDNGGGNWTEVTSNPFALAHAPSNPQRMYLSQGASGVAVSNSAGASFGTAVTVGDVVQALAVDPTNPDLVFAAGRDNGVYVSTNGGASWSLASVGIATRRIRSVAMSPGIPGTVVATADDGVYQTTNGGTSWSRVTTSTGVLKFHPTATARVYLCGTSLSLSLDSGATFVASGATGTGCQQLVFDGATFFAAGQPGGLRKSINSGGQWDVTGLAGDAAFGVALAGNASTVVVASGSGISRSTNGGTSFTEITNDLASSLLADPAMPSRIIAGLGCGTATGGAESTGGFRVSTDGGATFGNVIDGPCVSELTSNGTAIFAAARPRSAVSTDGGATWLSLGEGVPTGVEVLSATASADGKTIYFGTTAGLYKTTTGGQ